MADDSTISLDEDGDNFVLTRTQPDGTTTSITLSPQNVMTLAQSAPLFRERVLSRIYPLGGGVSPVFATVTAQARVAPDALGEAILLTLIAPNGAGVTFEIAPSLARELAERIPVHLAEMDGPKPKVQ